MNSIKRFLGGLRLLRIRKDLSYFRAPVALANYSEQQGRLLLCNLAFARLMGYSTIDACLKHSDFCEHLDNSPLNSTVLTTLRALNILYGQQLSIRSADGVVVTVNCNLVRDPATGHIDLAVVSAVSDAGGVANEPDKQVELEQAQLELAQYKQRLLFSLQATGSAYWEWDLENNTVTDVGTGAGDSSPHIAANPASRNFVFDGIPEEDQRQVSQSMHACLSASKELYEAEFRMKNAEGVDRWIRDWGVITARNNQGEAVQLMGLRTDITELKRAEQYQSELQTQLFQARKMHAIGQLTGGFAHDFNNILASIIGYTTLLMEKGKESFEPKFKEYLREVHKAGNMGQAMIDQMLRFVRNDSIEMAPAMINLLTRDAVQLIRSSMPSSIDLQVSIDDQIPSVETNSFKLSQMLMNLCVNAKDAMQGRGSLEISLDLQSIAKLTCSACGEAMAGQFVQLAVADSGVGIKEGVLPEIFAEFFTTKAAGKGTGMGLSIVNNLIHEHKGHIHVSSRAGRGTRFRLLFPPTRKISPDQSVIHLGASRFQPLKRGHILVVDDDKSVGSYIADVLRHHGHRVTILFESERALELFQDKPNSFNVVVTDQVMPGLTGSTMMQAMKRVRINVPVIICSAYSENMNEHDAMTAGAQGYLEKPINVDRLLELIEQSL